MGNAEEKSRVELGWKRLLQTDEGIHWRCDAYDVSADGKFASHLTSKSGADPAVILQEIGERLIAMADEEDWDDGLSFFFGKRAFSGVRGL